MLKWFFSGKLTLNPSLAKRGTFPLLFPRERGRGMS